MPVPLLCACPDSCSPEMITLSRQRNLHSAVKEHNTPLVLVLSYFSITMYPTILEGVTSKTIESLALQDIHVTHGHDILAESIQWHALQVGLFRTDLVQLPGVLEISAIPSDTSR